MFKKGDILSQDTLVGYYPMCAENYSEIDLKQLITFFRDTNSFILVEESFDVSGYYGEISKFQFFGGVLKIPVESYKSLSVEYLNNILTKMTFFDIDDIDELEDIDDYLSYIFQCRVQQYGGPETDEFILFEVESE